MELGKKHFRAETRGPTDLAGLPAGSESADVQATESWRGRSFATPIVYRMECVKVSSILHMAKLLSQGALQSAGELLHPGFEAAVHLISHQWLSFCHPDPDSVQLRRLQEVFRAFAAGDAQSLFRNQDWESFLTNVSRSTGARVQHLERAASDITSRSATSAAEDVLQGLLWIDFCSIPQFCDVADEEDEDALSEKRSGQLAAIHSIPAYVERADYFWVLAPTARHAESEVTCNFCTWRSRGWCRLEEWANLLAMRRKMPLIITDAPLLTTLGMVDHVFSTRGNPEKAVCSGQFTCCRLGHVKGPCDRVYVTQVLESMYITRLAVLRDEGHAVFHRLYLTLQRTMFANSCAEPEALSADETVEDFRQRIDWEGDMHAVDDLGASLFYFAVCIAHPQLIRRLAQLLPEFVTQPNNIGVTPLMQGVWRNDCLRELLAAGIGLDQPDNVNKCSNSGITALHHACSNGFAQQAQLLVEYAAMVDVRRRDNGRTPLLAAAASGYLDCINVLLRWRSDPCVVDARRNNGLHLAANSIAVVGNIDESERLRVVKLLLDSMVDPEAENDDEMTPTAIARQVRFDACGEFLNERTLVVPPFRCVIS